MEFASEELREHFVKVLLEEMDKDYIEQLLLRECIRTGNYDKVHKWREERGHLGELGKCRDDI